MVISYSYIRLPEGKDHSFAPRDSIHVIKGREVLNLAEPIAGLLSIVVLRSLTQKAVARHLPEVLQLVGPDISRPGVVQQKQLIGLACQFSGSSQGFSSSVRRVFKYVINDGFAVQQQ